MAFPTRYLWISGTIMRDSSHVKPITYLKADTAEVLAQLPRSDSP